MILPSLFLPFALLPVACIFIETNFGELTCRRLTLLCKVLICTVIANSIFHSPHGHPSYAVNEVTLVLTLGHTEWTVVVAQMPTDTFHIVLLVAR